MIYKPFGMLSQFTREVPEHVTLADLNFNFSKDVYPVGRLDADSEGLLLLTNDRFMNSKLLNPKAKQPKTYWVQVEGNPDEAALKKLRGGLTLRIKKKEFKTGPCKAFPLRQVDLPPRVPPIRVRKTVPDSWLSIQLTEGKNRQVRRMCAAIGFPVLRLVRVGLAGFELGSKPLEGFMPGDVRRVVLNL